MDKLKVILAGAGGFLAYWLGGLDNLLVALIAVIVIDYITGVLKAIHMGSLCSAAGFGGIVRKVLMLSVVALSFIIESLVDGTLPLREVVIMFFVANEGLSILENCAQAGLPIPEKLRVVLSQVGGDEEDDR